MASAALDRLPDAPALPRGPARPRQEGQRPLLPGLWCLQACVPMPGEANCKMQVVEHEQWLAPDWGWGALFCCPLCLKGSSVVPLCLLGSQQVLTHFEPTFFSSPVEESPSPMTHVDSVSLTPVA